TCVCGGSHSLMPCKYGATAGRPGSLSRMVVSAQASKRMSVVGRMIGLVQICLFLGNTAHPGRSSVGRYTTSRACCRSVARETCVAEQLQPVGMALAVQQLGRASVDPVGLFAPQIAAM